MVKTHLNYIGGKWIKSSSGKTLENINPANGKLIAKFQVGTREDVDRAVKAARKAFPAWRDTPAPERGDILLKTSLILEKKKDELAKLMTMENGKIFSESRGDVQEAIDMFQYMAGEGRRLFGETTPSELRNKFCLTVRDPIGVVGMITPWNFPMAIPSWKIAPALVCGNTIVFKPATPMGSRKVQDFTRPKQALNPRPPPFWKPPAGSQPSSNQRAEIRKRGEQSERCSF